MLVIFGSIPLAIAILGGGLPIAWAAEQGRKDALLAEETDKAVGAALFLAQEPRATEMFDYEFRERQLSVTWAEMRWLESERDWNSAESVKALASILSRQ